MNFRTSSLVALSLAAGLSTACSDTLTQPTLAPSVTQHDLSLPANDGSKGYTAETVIAGAPTSCAGVKQLNPSAVDGEFGIQPQTGVSFKVYCADMNTASPKEYITLAKTGGNYNFSSTYRGGYTRVQFTKIRILPGNLHVDIGDTRFSTSTNPNVALSYGHATDCSWFYSNTGRANIDLSGTPFKMTSPLYLNGYAARGTVNGVTRSVSGTVPMATNTQVVNFTGGGYCGGVSPNPISMDYTFNSSGGTDMTLGFVGPSIDVTGPSITPTVTGTQGANGWFTSPVAVSFAVADAESPITSKVGCDARTFSTDGASLSTLCTASSIGGTSRSTVSFKIDATAPTFAQAQVSPAAPTGSNGWYKTPVSLSIEAADATSGLFSTDGCSNTFSTDTQAASITCAAVDRAGNSAKSTSPIVKVDVTAPTVRLSASQAVYTVDQTVSFSCGATDATSGVAKTACPANGDAYTFVLGANTATATGTDYAGNIGSATTGFTVSVTEAGICSLVERFVSNKGVAHSLCTKIVKGNVEPFNNELSAQSGKKISAENAALLSRLAAAL